MHGIQLISLNHSLNHSLCPKESQEESKTETQPRERRRKGKKRKKKQLKKRDRREGKSINSIYFQVYASLDRFGVLALWLVAIRLQQILGTKKENEQEEVN